MSQSRKPASELPFEEQLAYARQLSEQALREQQAQAQREYLFFQKTLRLSIDEAMQAKKQYENEILNTMYAQKASWEDEQQRIAKLAPKAIKTKTFFSRRDEPTSKALQKDEIYNHAVFNSYPL